MTKSWIKPESVTMSLPHKVVVTGAASGIGATIADALVQRGVSVLALDSRWDGQIKESLDRKVLHEEVDVRRRDGVVRAIEGFCRRSHGDIGLIHAAAVTVRERISAGSETSDRELVETNILGTLNVVRAFVEAIEYEGVGGSIVLVSSVNAKRALPEQPVYSATKAAVDSLVHSLAVELGPRGVRVNSLSPGAVVTPMNPGLSGQVAIGARIPLRRVAATSDMVGPTFFLLSDLAGYVTGADLVVDGGMLCAR